MFQFTLKKNFIFFAFFVDKIERLIYIIGVIFKYNSE